MKKNTGYDRRVAWVRGSAALAVVTLALLCAAPATALSDRRDITKSFPAASLQGFSVEARVGDISIRAAQTSEITLRLELEARDEGGGWFWRGRKGNPHAVELDAHSSGGTLRLTLRGERKGLRERWTLQVPARLAAEAKLEVGDLQARGLEGGVRFKVNVGDIEIDIPQGGIDAKVNVGDIRARTATDAYDYVHLESNVGDADLRVGARRIESSGRRRYGPGEDVRWSGTGRDRIRLEVNVGDASLDITKS
jgi:hypothetical protein